MFKVKLRAFTLAEVLITLGIIGVVAAITIPTLITNHQKRQTVVKLQRAISVMNQAYRLAYDDVGEVSAAEAKSMTNDAYFNKFWAPYLKTSIICKTYKQCGYDLARPFKYQNGGIYDFNFVSTSARTTFYTSEGFLYVVLIYGGKDSLPSSDIYVDINGSKKPNILGKDVFILKRVLDGEKGGVVLPDCYNLTNERIDEYCKSSGTCCAEKIKRAGWNIDKSYPWK